MTKKKLYFQIFKCVLLSSGDKQYDAIVTMHTQCWIIHVLDDSDLYVSWVVSRWYNSSSVNLLLMSNKQNFCNLQFSIEWPTIETWMRFWNLPQLCSWKTISNWDRMDNRVTNHCETSICSKPVQWPAG